MLLTRIIPCLLLEGQGLVKTIKFKNPTYIGDPINAVKIFNEKESDELLVLDISVTNNTNGINFNLISNIAEECFMPFSYGGGINELGQIEKLLRLGVEKVVLNSVTAKDPEFIKNASIAFGGSTIIVSIDVKKRLFNKYGVFVKGGRSYTGFNALDHAVYAEEQGAGELIITSMERDGTMLGYDLDLIKLITGSVSIPVIASGGAGEIKDFDLAINEAHASAAAAGSIFVYHGRRKAVLINYPTTEELEPYFT